MPHQRVTLPPSSFCKFSIYKDDSIHSIVHLLQRGAQLLIFCIINVNGLISRQLAYMAAQMTFLSFAGFYACDLSQQSMKEALGKVWKLEQNGMSDCFELTKIHAFYRLLYIHQLYQYMNFVYKIQQNVMCVGF